ncbi:MAG: hypothetical protein R3C49_22055 [Planctomycetaceae bacterium]
MLATHLDYRPDERERLASAKVINQLAATDPTSPAILVGDLNATPDSKTLQLFETAWVRANSLSVADGAGD